MATSATMALKRTLVEDATNTSRLLLLNSEQAVETRSPTDKTFILPPGLKSGGAYRHKIIIKSLQIPHVFRNIPDQLRVVWKPNPVNNPSLIHTLSISPGHWTSHDLANYLTKAFGLQGGPRVYYDKTIQGFQFVPYLSICKESSFNYFLGITPGYEGNLSQSQFPVDMVTLKGIIVQTNYAVHNLPIGGIIGYVPVDGRTCFGNRINYYDYQATDYNLVMDDNLDRLEISLRNQDNRPLYTLTASPTEESAGYFHSVPPWVLTLKIVTVINENYSLPLHLTPSTQTSVNFIDEEGNQATKKKNNKDESSKSK